MLTLFMTHTTMAESIFGAQTLMAVSANKCLRTIRTNDNRMFLPTEN